MEAPLFFIFIINIRMSTSIIDPLYNAGKHVWKLNTIFDDLQLGTCQNFGVNEHLSNTSMFQEMKKQLDTIHEQFEQLEKSMGSKNLVKIVESWLLDASTMKDIDTIDVFTQSIDESYDSFYQVINTTDHSHSSLTVLLQDFFPTAEIHIKIIRRILTESIKCSSNGRNFMDFITHFIINHEAEICGTPRVIPNILIELISKAILAEMKTTTMLFYGDFLEFLESNDQKKYTKLTSNRTEQFEKQFADYLKVLSIKMEMLSSTYNRACDPPDGNWSRGVSFHELEKTFQAHIFGYNYDNCRYENCNHIEERKFKQCLPNFYAETEHPNNITGCFYLGHITACILKNQAHKYQYVNSEKLGFLGKNPQCSENDAVLIENNSDWDISYATCGCYSSSNNNKISILMMRSEVEKNRIITGLRFIRRNNVLYIQPREGKLRSNGYIKLYSQRWINIPRNIDSSLIEPINEKNRAFFLTDLVLPPTFVLTGVRFYKVTREKVSGFDIEIYGTKFDFKTGELFPESSFTRSFMGSKSGTSLSFNPVSSVFTKMPHKVTFSNRNYILLKQSELKNDFGQSTLPLFDAVPLQIGVSSPLSGVGIFHKGVEDYAGMISLRVYGIKYSTYFQDFELCCVDDGRVLFNSTLY